MGEHEFNFSIIEAKLFCLLYDIKETSKVAKILGRTSPAINLMLHRLEKKLNAGKLFTKEKKHAKYKPTESAENMIEAMRYIVEFSEDVKAGSVKTDSSITIISTHSMLHYCLANWVKGFLTENPKISLNFKQNDDLKVENQSVNEILLTCFVDDKVNKLYLPYHSFIQKLWANPEYIDKHGNPSTMQELQEHTLLLRKNVDDPRILFGSNHIRSQLSNYPSSKVLNIYSASLIDTLCRQGCGIMAGSEELVKLANLELENVFPGYRGDNIDIYVCIHKKFLESNSAAKKVINWIFEARNAAFRKIAIQPAFPFTPLK
jgi:DNA-binding transcriptional LysR family regulator